MELTHTTLEEAIRARDFTGLRSAVEKQPPSVDVTGLVIYFSVAAVILRGTLLERLAV